MLTDLRYALRQLKPIMAMRGDIGFDRDRVQRAIDALERCIEAAPAMEAAYDAQMEAMEEAEAERRRQACIGAELPAGFVDRLAMEAQAPVSSPCAIPPHLTFDGSRMWPARRNGGAS